MSFDLCMRQWKPLLSIIVTGYISSVLCKWLLSYWIYIAYITTECLEFYKNINVFIEYILTEIISLSKVKKILFYIAHSHTQSLMCPHVKCKFSGIFEHFVQMLSLAPLSQQNQSLVTIVKFHCFNSWSMAAWKLTVMEYWRVSLSWYAIFSVEVWRLMLRTPTTTFSMYLDLVPAWSWKCQHLHFQFHVNLTIPLQHVIDPSHSSA